MLVLPQVPLAHPPGGVLAGEQPFDALFLLFLADVEEELQHQVPVVGEGPLEPLDAVHPLGVGLAVQLVGLQLLDGLVHPAGVQEGDLLEETVEEGLAGLLLRGGGGHGEHLEKPGIDIADDLPDDAALPGSAPSLDEHQHRQLLLLEQHLLGRQLFLDSVQALLHFLFPGFFRAVPIFQHGLHLASGPGPENSRAGAPAPITAIITISPGKSILFCQKIEKYFFRPHFGQKGPPKPGLGEPFLTCSSPRGWRRSPRRGSPCAPAPPPPR